MALLVLIYSALYLFVALVDIVSALSYIGSGSM